MVRTLRTRSLFFVALTFALLVGLVFPAMAAPDGKSFTADLTPTSVTAGTTVPFELTVTNTSDNVPLGAIEITAPDGFDVRSLLPSLPDWSVTSMDPLQVAADSSQARLAPGSSIVVEVTAFVAPIQTSTTSYSFGVEARQANNFSGALNDLNLVLAAGDGLDVTVTGEVVDCTGKQRCSSTPRTEGNTTATVSTMCAVTDCGTLAVDLGDVTLGGPSALSQEVFWNPPTGAVQDAGAVEVRLVIDKNSYKGSANAIEFFIAATDSSTPELCGTNQQIVCSYTVGKIKGGHIEIVANVEPIDPRGFAS